jgi:transposase InsO family protein
MLLTKHTAMRKGRVHDGKVMVMRSNLHWYSDGLEFTCWNGEVVRMAFIIDAFDREIIAWSAVANAGISGSDVRDMMLEAVEKRFKAMRASQPVEPLSDNGSAYTVRETRLFAVVLNLVPCFTAVASPQSNGMSESFVNTLKRDYIPPLTNPGRRNGALADLPKISLESDSPSFGNPLILNRHYRLGRSHRVARKSFAAIYETPLKFRQLHRSTQSVSPQLNDWIICAGPSNTNKTKRTAIGERAKQSTKRNSRRAASVSFIRQVSSFDGCHCNGRSVGIGNFAICGFGWQRNKRPTGRNRWDQVNWSSRRAAAWEDRVLRLRPKNARVLHTVHMPTRPKRGICAIITKAETALTIWSMSIDVTKYDISYAPKTTPPFCFDGNCKFWEIAPFAVDEIIHAFEAAAFLFAIGVV